MSILRLLVRRINRVGATRQDRRVFPSRWAGRPYNPKTL